jgi:hypothetical protein
MDIFPVGIEHALEPPVQGTHNANASKIGSSST